MKITALKGVGKKTEQYFANMNIITVDDLLRHYPREYDIYEEPLKLNELDKDYENSVVAIEGCVVKNPDIFGYGKTKVLSCTLKDYNGDIFKIVFFNMPYLKNSLKQGSRYIFRGRIKNEKKIWTFEQPKIFTLGKYNEIKGNMMPIYPLTKGITNNLLIKCVGLALENYSFEKEFIPPEIREKYELAERNFAIKSIHFPQEFDDYIKARHRLAFEEFFLFILAILSLKTSKDSNPNNFNIKRSEFVDDFIKRLPFSLTYAQLKTVEEIRQDISGSSTMSRLVQGDVGSGKTIVAIIALLEIALSGYQGAMMVPTEVLAIQQYESISNLFKEFNINIGIELLVGSMTVKQKRLAYERIKEGESKIIVGTHALIQEKVEYNNLALVVTDEQHRFGVVQRENFANKGKRPHILVMSATPIPRTLAIILYGDLDISIIDEMPKGRLPIKNCVVDESYRKNADNFLRKEVAAGHQCYVICPMVEESENFTGANVIDYSSELKVRLPECRIKYLHGKLRPQEKEDIMKRFAKHEIDILVSTTVIEVGVNVPNATVMLIENSEMFGLAQLHQLRGRVGRGDSQSFCIFMMGKNNEKTRKRLDILNKSNDGFEIARKDLELRGPGDFFGTRQSGDFDFGIADIFADSSTLKEASDAAKLIFDSDNTLSLPQHDDLHKKVVEYTRKVLDKINL